MNPYIGLPSDRFWKTGVVTEDPAQISLYDKKFDISAEDGIFTAGSCFAQNVTRWLKSKKLNFLDGEPAPLRMSDELALKYQYGVYSCRYGNIYTARQLKQILLEARGSLDLSDRIVWRRKDGKYVDALRTTIDPNGFDTPDEVIAHRKQHLSAIAKTLKRTKVFVFTLGLTEAWLTADRSVVYPVAPGVSGGDYDPSAYVFHNFTMAEVLEDMRFSIRLIKRFAPSCKFIMTVSPVALAATAAPRHVLVSTIYSKSVLRAVAGQLADENPDVDYFPSYELITNITSRGMFYNADCRTVTQTGVGSAMRMFGDAHFPEVMAGAAPAPARPATSAVAKLASAKPRDICEEELLAAFHPKLKELAR